MSRTQHLVRSSLLVIAIFGLNKVTGLVKLFLMTAAFGTGAAADAYAAANQLPELFLAMLAGGAVAAAFIPVYSASRDRDVGAARGLSDTVLTLTLLCVGGVCAGAAILAPWLVSSLLVPNFPLPQQALTADLMRIILFSSLLISVGSIFTSLLHAHQHFLAPALATVVIDLGQIWGLYVWAPVWGIHGVAWGSVLGAALLTLIQIPALWRRNIGYRPRLALRLAGIRELGHLLWPRVVTLGAFQAVDIVFISLASGLPEGSIAAYFYAMLAMVAMPKSLFGGAIASVIFPTMAEAYNDGDRGNLLRTVVQGLRGTWMLVLPAAVGLVVLGRPAVAFLFQRGSFGTESTDLVYALMAILSLRLVGDATADILSLIFFARHDTRSVMWANLGWMGLHIGLSVMLVQWGDVLGLAWAASLASLALVAALYALNRWSFGALHEELLGTTLGRILLACAGMSAVVLGLHRMGLDVMLFLVTAIGAGGLTFVLIYFILGGREMVSVWRLLWQRAT